MRISFKAENAQVLPIVALLVVALIGMLGLAIDMGRLFVARTELSRAVDAAALAGVLELPDVPAAEDRARAYLVDNESDATATFPVPDSDGQLRVTGSRDVDMLFMSIFGFGEINVDVTAAAGFGAVPLDVVMGIDSSYSMGASPCNSSQNNTGCPIKEAKDAATAFADLLLGTGAPDGNQVGVAPYNDCYAPPFSGFLGAFRCVAASLLIYLTPDEPTVLNGINGISANGWTNVCFGLKQSGDILFGPGSRSEDDALHIIVFLSDGDNNYNSQSYSAPLDQPPSPCRPSDPTTSDAFVNSSGCNPAQSRERELDLATWNLANSLKAQGAEIYVVGLGTCGSADNSYPSLPGYCTGIGNPAHDNEADRRVLKCIASSADGTNDHYFEVASAVELPEVFSQIALGLAFRLVE